MYLIMACNSCSKSFSLLRKEKGCPSCGFSYCSNCLKYKIFVPKLNSEAKVCMKCERDDKTKDNANFEPPDAYYKRIGSVSSGNQIIHDNKLSNFSNPGPGSSTDHEISNRLQKLKQDSSLTKQVSTEDVAKRLQKIKGEVPSVSDAELQLRLANIKGVSVDSLQSKQRIPLPDNKTENEEVEDLLKQYMEHASIDAKYQNEFQGVIENIESRLNKLRNTENANDIAKIKAPDLVVESEDEDVIINKIVDKAKAESQIEDDVESHELPFCEICNEDANMRCLGCKYLFCKRCFVEHKDEDDGCDKYESYRPPVGFTT